MKKLIYLLIAIILFSCKESEIVNKKIEIRNFRVASASSLNQTIPLSISDSTRVSFIINSPLPYASISYECDTTITDILEFPAQPNGEKTLVSEFVSIKTNEIVLFKIKGKISSNDNITVTVKDRDNLLTQKFSVSYYENDIDMRELKQPDRIIVGRREMFQYQLLRQGEPAVETWNIKARVIEGTGVIHISDEMVWNDTIPNFTAQSVEIKNSRHLAMYTGLTIGNHIVEWTYTDFRGEEWINTVTYQIDSSEINFLNPPAYSTPEKPTNETFLRYEMQTYESLPTNYYYRLEGFEGVSIYDNGENIAVGEKQRFIPQNRVGTPPHYQKSQLVLSLTEIDPFVQTHKGRVIISDDWGREVVIEEYRQGTKADQGLRLTPNYRLDVNFYEDCAPFPREYKIEGMQGVTHRFKFNIIDKRTKEPTPTGTIYLDGKALQRDTYYDLPQDSLKIVIDPEYCRDSIYIEYDLLTNHGLESKQIDKTITLSRSKPEIKTRFCEGYFVGYNSPMTSYSDTLMFELIVGKIGAVSDLVFDYSVMTSYDNPGQGVLNIEKGSAISPQSKNLLVKYTASKGGNTKIKLSVTDKFGQRSDTFIDFYICTIDLTTDLDFSGVIYRTTKLQPNESREFKVFISNKIGNSSDSYGIKYERTGAHLGFFDYVDFYIDGIKLDEYVEHYGLGEGEHTMKVINRSSEQQSDGLYLSLSSNSMKKTQQINFTK